MRKNFKTVFEQFRIYGDFIKAVPYGNGHINDTYAVSVTQCGKPVRYLFQRINHTVFKEPVKLMDNINRISVHLQEKLSMADDPDRSRKSLTVILTETGMPYYRDVEGNFWRCYLFIEGAVGYDIIENREQAYQAARSFGEFQKLLTDLPGERLYETIPDFHNTPKRFKRFQEVLKLDPCNRKQNVIAEADFYFNRKSEINRLIDLNSEGLIPERITHNDTKLNNVLIDTDSNEGVCVIDLDTSMPGLVPYDFGDLLRTSTSPVAEDEPDSSMVFLQTDMFEALVRGYLSSAATFLTTAEKDNLLFGGKLMTYEVGLRFLTDYLEGDVYFKTKYGDQNLVRSRNQMALVKSIEANQAELEDFIIKEYERIMEK